jgi:uncharacterized protein
MLAAFDRLARMTLKQLRRIAVVVLVAFLSLTSSCATHSTAGIEAPAAQTDVTFTSGDIRLHGRFYTPQGRGPYPTILYVTGSGGYSLLTDAYAQNTTRAFVDRGMAVLVFDNRGVGQSGGQPAPWDLAGKAGDVSAALDFLARHPQVERRRIVVWALSQAGWFAPQAIQGRREVQGLILVSPAGLNPIDNSGRSAQRELVAAGVTGAELEEALTLWRTLWRYQGDAENYEAVREMLGQAPQRTWYATARASPSWQDLPATPDALLSPEDLRRAWAEKPKDYEWLRERANFVDYAPVYRSIRKPVLVVYGAADTLIDPVQSRGIFETAFAQSRHRDVTITTYAAAGHGIQARGDPEHPMPAYLTEITDWALKRFGR